METLIQKITQLHTEALTQLHTITHPEIRMRLEERLASYAECLNLVTDYTKNSQQFINQLKSVNADFYDKHLGLLSFLRDEIFESCKNKNETELHVYNKIMLFCKEMEE